MNITVEIQELVNQLAGVMLVFLPVLFGAVEFIKDKLNLTGRVVEFVSIGIFVLFGVLLVASLYHPERGAQAAAIMLFLLMCALAPSGYYKFINRRASRDER